MSNTFDWIEIRTKDIEKTAHFYESLFGWRVLNKETAEGSPVWIFDTGGEPRLENLRRAGIWLRPSDEIRGFVVYVLVDDIEATLKRVVELGGKVATPKAPIGAGYGAYFTDPEGNYLGLYEDKKGDQP
jgi:predicted enzyme related to lactoylglutathione lyase